MTVCYIFGILAVLLFHYACQILKRMPTTFTIVSEVSAV